MKHTFIGDKGLTLRIGDDIANLTEISCNELTSIHEFEVISVKGDGLHRMLQLVCGNSTPNPWGNKPSFECSVYDGDELVIHMWKVYSVQSIFDELDEEELLFDYCEFGTCHVAAEVNAIHVKNHKYRLEHQPDYSECDD